jgi:hypothetical protein
MKFNVKIKRTVEHTAQFEVTALNEDDAETKALEKVEKQGSQIVWEEDDTEYDFQEVEEVEDFDDDDDLLGPEDEFEIE